MAELKTQPTGASLSAFLKRIEDPSLRQDCRTLIAMMRSVTKETPKMWGSSMVGFGRYHYKYASGREGDWFLTGFAPRRRELTVYLMSGFEPLRPLMRDLGAYKTGKSCLYVKRLSDVRLPVLRRMIVASVRHTKRAYA